MRGLRGAHGPQPTRSDDIFELHRKQIAAVLTDPQMRCGDGDKFVEWLNQQDGQLPIIVMTGSVEEETRNLLQQHKVVWLHTPFATKELLDVVAESLAASGITRQAGKGWTIVK